jgi:lipoprotein-releasing system permease protein
MYKLAFALRYLKRKRVSFLAIGGTALGVLAFIVVLGVMQGFTQEMRERMRDVLGDLRIQSPYQVLMASEEWISLIESCANVKGCSRQLEGFAILKVKREGARKPSFKYCMFRGVDPVREARVIDLGEQEFLTEAGENLPGEDTGEMPWLVGGKELLDNPQVRVDDVVRLVILEDVGGRRYFSREFRVAGKFSSGMYDFDSKYVYIPLWAASQLLPSENGVHQFTVALRDPGKLRESRDELQALLTGEHPGSGNLALQIDVDRKPSARVQTYEELNQNLFAALKLQTSLATYILVFYFLVAGFVIIAIMSMMVLQKTRDIGIMRALGGSTFGVLRVFLNYGLMIGTIGAAIGAVAGLVLLDRLDWIRQAIVRLTGWDPFPAELYVFEQIPRQISPTSLIAVLLGAVALGLLAATYPAVRAARMDPARTLRYE